MTTLHHPAPQGAPFAIYEDPEDQEPLSPSVMYEGDISYDSAMSPSAADEAVTSIKFEHSPDDGPEPYRSSYTSRKSESQPRRSSGMTHYSFVSAIPSDSSNSSKPITQATQALDPGYISRKDRPRFRNPESVRAMHMSSPVYEATRERVKGSYKTPSRSGRSETPVSRRSESRLSTREHRSPRPTPTPQQPPLVLLHVTILPMHIPYPHEIMTRIMPGWLVENYKLLEEKLQDIILMRRGLLIPHPRDEYDLLEERILESLELKTPRILPCGHFVPPDDDSEPDEDEDEDDVASIPDDATGRGSRMSGGTLTEDKTDGHRSHASTCMDCHRALKRPGQGVGAGTRKWDIKIYAANGLMRAPAWTACWNDMERCDVEISPWMPEDIRKTLEKRAQEEQEADQRKQLYTAELQRQIQEAASKQKAMEEAAKAAQEQKDMELQRSFDAAAAALQRSVEDKAAEKRRFEEALEIKIEEAKESVRLQVQVQALSEREAVTARIKCLEEALGIKTKTPSGMTDRRKHTRHVSESEEDLALMSAISDSLSKGPQSGQIPLSTLLGSYFQGLLSDQRNWIILLLGAAVVFLSMNMTPTPMPSASPQLTATPTEALVKHSVATVAVTTTATAFSTLTVTQVQTAANTEATAWFTPAAANNAAVLADHPIVVDMPVVQYQSPLIRKPRVSPASSLSNVLTPTCPAL
ncbi:hypothetical protein ACN47E_004030 [Coniothyrium glycines]